MTAKLQNHAAASGSLAQDANGLNYFLLPFQASRTMKTGVVVTNGLTHRTYRKNAIAPTLLLQANTKRTGDEPLAVWRPSGRRPRVPRFVSEPCNN